MFTGIIEEVGKVASIKKGAKSCVLTVNAKKILSDIHLGDSIAVNGICLTVTSFDEKGFTVDVMHETLNRSSIGKVKPGSSVNLERAMLLGGRFGGHIVSGHIDGTGVIKTIEKDDNAIWYTIRTDPKILRYIIEKGSIAIDGISLTVAKVGSDTFSVSIIPHTAANTILAERKIGDIVNLENDCVGKYIAKLFPGVQKNLGNALEQGMQTSSSRSSAGTKTKGLTKEFLLENGF